MNDVGGIANKCHKYNDISCTIVTSFSRIPGQLFVHSDFLIKIYDMCAFQALLQTNDKTTTTKTTATKTMTTTK